MSGIYIHIPFCINKCIYCDFYSVTDLSLEDAFTDALLQEIQLAGQKTTGKSGTKIDTIYFGGGTPSAIKAENIGKILATLSDCYPLDRQPEITIEVNPGTVSANRLVDYRALGINRINAGIQSFNDNHLRFLNRIHSADEAEAFIISARKAGFGNIGIDLIYCLPNQTEKEWKADLEKAIRFSPEHLSCYILTYEEETPLFKQYINGSVSPAAEEVCSDLFETTIDYLTSQGYQHYEISNFSSSPATRSRHNYKYWNFSSYRGFGPSAHSYESENARRFWNVSDISSYIQILREGKLPVEDEEVLTPEQKMIEALFLGLRKTEGINIPLFNTVFNTDFQKQFRTRIKELSDSGLITMTGTHCRLSRKGILLADRIASLFVDDLQ